ncbi:MAG: peptidoglycan-binding domain-containing protein [Minicystis sp.]
MSEKMRPYVVRQGDYLTKLAFVHGFDVDEVWSDPKNDEIRGLRKDHNILAPGDVIHLPVKEKEGLPIQKGVTNRYVAKVPKTTLKLRFRDGAAPLAQQRYLVEGAATPSEGSSGDDGQIELTVPVHVTELVVVFPDKKLRFAVRVGHLDPIDERFGLIARLVQLGYLLPPPGDFFGGVVPGEEVDGEDDARLRFALRAFQADRGLDPNGSLDDATREALKSDHGA